MSVNQQISLFDIGQVQEQASKPHSLYSSLVELTQHCQGCTRCELSQHRNRVVIGRGNPDADLMLVGEAPGEQEDRTGLPFVGKAGKLLDKILASVNLDSEQDVYMTNIVRCRPPKNRTPTPRELEACRPYLLEQIRLVNPKILILVGATAMKGLTGDTRSISQVRGEWISWQGIPCRVIFHPAYLLRNPSRKRGSPKWQTWQDLIAIRLKWEEVRLHLFG